MGDDGSRFARLNLLEYHLRQQGLVGTCETPGPYYSGTTAMSIAILENTYAYFGGTLGRAVALVGSPCHLIGQSPKQLEMYSRGFSAYLSPHILNAFARRVGEEIEPKSSKEQRTDHSFSYYIDWINRDTPGPPQNVEFLARRLCEADDSILGTPLYVALAD